MHRPTPRRTRRPTRAAIVLVSLVTTVGCTSAGGTGTVDGAEYVTAMEEICTTTSRRLEALPEPPEQIRPTDWAAEVAASLRAEATAADALVVTGDVRADHRTYVSTVGDLADAYDTLAVSLADDPGSIGPVRDEITSLSLGRDDVAELLELPSCRRRSG